MEFSEEQKKVIASRGKNLLVSAAAGSGKTTVLVARILSLIDEDTDVNIDQLLICTFTKAASADMRRKLYEKLSERAQDGDERSREQLERLDFASISTLHSFCSRLIRRNFEQADVDPNFRILDESENAAMKEQALTDALEEAYAAPTEDMLGLSARRTPNGIRQMVSTLHAFLSELPEPEAWMQNTLGLYDSRGDAWLDVLASAAKIKLRRARMFLLEGLRVCRMPEGPMFLERTLLSDISKVEAALELDYDSLHEYLGSLKLDTAAKAKKNDIFSAELKKKTSDFRDDAKDEVKKAAGLTACGREDAMEDLRGQIPALRALFRLTERTEELLSQAKKEADGLTYNDLEHVALRVLEDEDVCRRMREKYRYVFVDEYQDTSDIQEAIVRRIAGENNRFMVGDIKQSIYRFRGAEPDLFKEAASRYAEGGNNEMIVLSKNYRSRRPVIDFVNLVFKRVMHGGESEIVYDEDAKLHQGKFDFKGPDEPVELHLIETGAGADGEYKEQTDEGSNEQEGSETAASKDETNEEELKGAELEAVVIARRIREMMAEDPGLQYRDFCIITRNRTGVLQPMAETLAREGIPSYTDDSENYYDAIEVLCVISVLKLLVNRRSDLDLLTVLRSPMFGLTTRELALLRIRTPEGRLWKAVENARSEIPGADRFLKLYGQWKALSRFSPVNLLIRRILSDTGFYLFMGALPGGEHRQGNLDMLCRTALKYETERGGTLAGFLNLVAGMQSRGEGEASHELSENDNVVRVMTSHGSKGLEFKVVIAAMLSRKLAGSHDTCKAESRLFLSKALGAGMYFWDETLDSLRKTAAQRAIETAAMNLDLAEELRVLYVTLTRAQERLVLVGRVKNLVDTVNNWSMAQSDPDYYSTDLDIIGAAVLGCPGSEVLEELTDQNKPEVKTYLYRSTDITSAETPEAEDNNARLGELLLSEKADPELEAALSWTYPRAGLPYAPVKMAVTGLAREYTGGKELPEALEIPAFISGKDLTANTLRGTAVHACLQQMDLKAFSGMNYPEALREAERQLDDLCARQLLTAEEREKIKPSVPAHFMISALAERARSSELVKREWSFSMFMPTSAVVSGYPVDAKMMVQGCVDLCFTENGSWVLADYKTEWAEDDGEVLRRYSPQLRLYARALETVTGLPVKQAYLCLVAMDRFVEVPLKEEP